MRIPCDICYEPFNTNERKPMIPDCCGHTMCLQCVDKLPEKKCPMDQKPFHTCNLNIAINELIQMPRIKPPRDYENLFKICFVGESGVGKSTLLNRLIGSDINDTEVTIGLDMRFRSELYHNKRYKFQLWDTGGQERFRAITKAHYKNAHVILVVYSLHDCRSFQQLEQYWLEQVRQHSPVSKVFIVGNKLDLDRKVSEMQIKNLCSKYNCEEIKVSCFENLNIEPAWRRISQYLIEEMPRLVWDGEASSKMENSQLLSVHKSRPPHHQNSCC